MVLPTMVAISRDVLAVVPHEQVEGALALGATRWQVLRKVVVPGARTGILGGFTLAMGRALGETVAVALVIGNSPFIAHSLKSPAATLASLIVNNFGEATGTELGRPVRGRHLVLLVIGVVGQRPGPRAGAVDGPPAVRRRWRWPDGTTLTFDASADPILAAGAARSRAWPQPRWAGARSIRGSRWACAGRSWCIAIIPLVAVVVYVVIKGLPAWNTDFFTHADHAGGDPRWWHLERHRGHRRDRVHRHRGDRAPGLPCGLFLAESEGRIAAARPLRRRRDDRGAVDHHRHLRLHRHREELRLQRVWPAPSPSGSSCCRSSSGPGRRPSGACRAS